MAQHALVMYVSRSQIDPHVQPLRFARADARALHALLARPAVPQKPEHLPGLGYGKRAQLLAEPTALDVRKALKQMREQVSAGDTVLFYFAGHGAVHAAEQYLLMANANALDLESGYLAANDLLSLNWLMEQVSHWPAVQAAYLLDACRTTIRAGVRGDYSAQMQEALTQAARLSMSSRDPLLRTRKTPGQAETEEQAPPLVMNACADGQRAYELELVAGTGQSGKGLVPTTSQDEEAEPGRGLFSYALELWLREEMNTPPASEQAGDALLMLGEFSVAGVQAKMLELANRHGGPREQTPWVLPRAQPVVLGRRLKTSPAGATKAGAMTSHQPGEAQVQPAGQDVADLLEQFERQLLAKQWASPLHDNCVATLTLMKLAGEKDKTLEAYAKRLEAAQAAQLAGEEMHEEVRLPAEKAQAAGFLGRFIEWLLYNPQPYRTAEKATQAPTVLRPASASAKSLTPAAAHHPCPLPGMAADKFGTYADLSFKGVVQRFRWIEPGSFLMGSPEAEPEYYSDEVPQHRVRLTKGFWLADTACTQGLWLAVVGGANPSRFQGDLALPVERVSWDQVNQLFLPRLQAICPVGVQATLPSEAQWEYACRAGTQTPFNFGEQISPEQVNYDGHFPYKGGPKGEYRQQTVAVKALPANGWGFYQMHGNVREWCVDGIRTYKDAEAVDPLGAVGDGPLAVRGGSWRCSAGGSRSASRYQLDRVFRWDSLGFRIALKSK